MHSKLLFLTLLLFSSLSYATDLFIKLGTTTNMAQIQQIQNIIKDKGYTLYLQEDDERFKLFAGVFQSPNSALQALQTLQPIFPKAAAAKLRPGSYRAMGSTENLQTTSKIATNKDTKELRAFFAQLSLGYHNTKGKLSGDVVAQEPSASGMSYGLGVGYMFNQNFWTLVGYDVLGTGDVTLNNIYASLNYNFYHTNTLSAHAGALVGYSTLSWDSAPQEGATTSGPSSFFAGVQTGICYPFGVEGLSLISSYSLISLNLKTNLKTNLDATDESAIEHTMIHKVQMGLRYNF